MRKFPPTSALRPARVTPLTLLFTRLIASLWRPRFSTPTTLVAMPEECQSIAHDGAERLEPEWVRQAAQQLVAPVVVDDRLADHSTRPRHAVGQPFRDVTAMQRQIGAAGFASHQRTPGDRDNCNFVVHYIGTLRLAGNRCRS